MQTVGVNEFQGLNVPLITIEQFLENGTGAVECDNIQGGCLAAEHLIAQGCRHLIHISGVHETAMPADERAAGFREVCEQKNVQYQVVGTHAYEYNHLEYHEVLEQLLLQHPDTDGIFASSDLIAAQLLRVCAKLGRKVPEQLKIVGFDDVNIASMTTPPITAIHQPIKEMAATAVELLVRAGEGQVVPSRTTLPVSLVVRGTTEREQILKDTRIFHFGTLSMTDEPVRSTTRHAIETAKANGAILSFDPNIREPLWQSTEEAKGQTAYGMEVCDVLKISDNEIRWFTGEEDFDCGVDMLWREYHIPLILLSMGSGGSRAYCGSRRAEQPAFLQAGTIETTGAGDTFGACCLHYILEHGMAGLGTTELEEMLRFANAAASIVTTRRGALRVMPEPEEIQAFLV